MKKYILLFFITLFLSGCSNRQVNKLPDCEVPDDHQNNEIVIIPLFKYYSTEDSIVVKVKNNSDSLISASYDFNLQIFQYDDTNEWKEINNISIYLQKNSINIPSQSTKFFGFDPKISNTTKQARIFICIYAVDENTKEKVGASKEFTLIQ
jgi:hypothetical protein